MSIASISRHTNEHLRLDLQAIQIEKRMQGAVNVELENREQLDAAKEVRDQAREYAATKPEGEIIPAMKAVMDGVKTVNVTLDTQSKLKGLYQQDRPNDQHYRDMLRELKAAVDAFIVKHSDKEPLEIARLLREEPIGDDGYIMATAHLLTLKKITPQEFIEIQGEQ